MHKAEIERKDLKIHFNDCKPVILSNQLDIADSIDLMPVVRLLSVVKRDVKIFNPAI